MLKLAHEIGDDFEWHDHHRVSKKRARLIIYSKGKEKNETLYRDLTQYIQKTLHYINNTKIVGQIQPQDTRELGVLVSGSRPQSSID